MLVFCLNCTLLSTHIWFSVMVKQGYLFFCVSVPASTLCPIKCYWLKNNKIQPVILTRELKKCKEAISITVFLLFHSVVWSFIIIYHLHCWDSFLKFDFYHSQSIV